MAFASIHIPGFLIQAAVRSEPALRNRAIVLVDGTPPLWTVMAANVAALQAGIQLGMAKTQAAQFCNLEIRHRSQPQEKAAHAALLDLGWSMSPRIEDTAPGTILADIAGLASLFGSPENIANEFSARAALLRLAANIAIASNIDAALLASRGFPGITVIQPEEESQRLGLLPVHVLPASPETLEILGRWGIRTCAALAALPLLDLSERLGQEGVRLHELSRGASVRSLALAQTSLFFEEEMELDDSVEELEPLSFILGRLLDQLCARLNTRSLAASSIHVRFQLDPAFENSSPRPKENAHRMAHKKSAEKKTYEKSMTLPVPMRDSKMLLKLLRLHLQSDPPAAPILKVWMAADPARPRPAQGGLFQPVSPDPEKLELTVARLANLVGDSNIGSPELVDTHRPGEFRLSRFLSRLLGGRSLNLRPLKNRKLVASVPALKGFSGARPFAFKGRDSDISDSDESCTKTRPSNPEGRAPVKPPCSGEKQYLPHPLTAFRIFRPPIPAKVDLRENRPALVSFNTLRGDVIAASGPWRTSGDWWRDDTWHHDEWDLELRFDSMPNPSAPGRSSSAPLAKSPQHGVYCLYFDSLRQSWFVRGVYD
jgi:protein ImuB